MSTGITNIKWPAEAVRFNDVNDLYMHVSNDYQWLQSKVK